MDSSNNQSLHTLTDEQMAVLVAVVLQEFGAGLTQAQFNEVMLAIFAHIPVFKTIPDEHGVPYCRILWAKYHQINQASRHRH